MNFSKIFSILSVPLCCLIIFSCARQKPDFNTLIGELDINADDFKKDGVSGELKKIIKSADSPMKALQIINKLRPFEEDPVYAEVLDLLLRKFPDSMEVRLCILDNELTRGDTAGLDNFFNDFENRRYFPDEFFHFVLISEKPSSPGDYRLYAEEIYKEAVESGNDGLLRDAFLLLALNGDTEKTKEVYEHYSHKFRDIALVVFFELGEYRYLLDLYDRGLIRGYSPLIAEALIHAGRYADAADLLYRNRSVYTGNPGIPYINGFIAALLSGNDTPEWYLIEGLAVLPDDASINTLLAQYYIDRRRSAAAVPLIKKAGESPDGNDLILSVLAYLAGIESSSAARFEAFLWDSLNRRPSDDNLREFMIWYFWARSDPDALRQILSMTAIADEADGMSHINALISVLDGDYRSAFDLMKRKADESEEWEWSFNAALIARGNGDFFEAEKYFEQSLSLYLIEYPNDFNSAAYGTIVYHYARALAAAGKKSRAEELLVKISGIEPLLRKTENFIRGLREETSQ